MKKNIKRIVVKEKIKFEENWQVYGNQTHVKWKEKVGERPYDKRLHERDDLKKVFKKDTIEIGIVNWTSKITQNCLLLIKFEYFPITCEDDTTLALVWRQLVGGNGGGWGVEGERNRV